MRKALLVLNGPMCAGKSTVVATLMQRDGFFRASSDTIKWLISNYSADTSGHRRMAQEITFRAMEAAMEQGLSAVVDGGHHAFRERYRALAARHGCRYVSVNIEAPYEVLKQRFLDRVTDGRKIDRPHISVTTVDGFDARYRWYADENKDRDAAATLDSSALTVEEIVATITEMVA